MKFPRPRQLEINTYPESQHSNPDLMHKLVNDFINPLPASDMYEYIENTIRYLKDQARGKVLAARLNNINIGTSLTFVPLYINPRAEPIQCLVDTGAANSLLHSDIASELRLPVQPASIRLVTATGTSDTAIQGISHV